MPWMLAGVWLRICCLIENCSCFCYGELLCRGCFWCNRICQRQDTVPVQIPKGYLAKSYLAIVTAGHHDYTTRSPPHTHSPAATEAMGMSLHHYHRKGNGVLPRSTSRLQSSSHSLTSSSPPSSYAIISQKFSLSIKFSGGSLSRTRR